MVIEREQLFGVDLQLGDRVGGLDLIPDRRDDLDLAIGVENITQALTLRLLVRQGELARLGYPSYGSRLHELIGEPNHARTHLKLMAYARKAIEQDPRVVKVQEVRAQVLPGERDTVRLLMEIQVVDLNSPLPLSFDFSLQGFNTIAFKSSLT
jgi:phage baseplate assembly protein W